jgi:uncharacterized protein YjbJ (UPF0337 family)
MNRDIFEGNWKQFKGRIKAQWGKLKGSHVDAIDGKAVEFTGKVQEGYGAIKDAAQQQIESQDEWTKR